MTDIVERLRAWHWTNDVSPEAVLVREAADEIERLRATLAKVIAHAEGDADEIECLRTVLKQIASCEKRANGDVVDIARAALEQKP